MYTEQQIFDELKAIMVDSFMLAADDIRMEADFFNDLDFDSIDLIDLAAKINSKTGKQLNPEQFRGMRTVGDVVKIVAKMSAENPDF